MAWAAAKPWRRWTCHDARVRAHSGPDSHGPQRTRGSEDGTGEGEAAHNGTGRSDGLTDGRTVCLPACGTNCQTDAMDSPSAHFAKESITLQHLQAFRKLFKEHAEQGVDERTFVTEFRRTAHAAGELGEAQLVELFLKIDANADGTLTWDEFTNFLFLDNHDTVDASSVGDEAQAMFVAAGIVDEPAHKLPTREAIVQTFLSGRPKEYLSVSRNGGFKLWRPAESRAPAQALPGGRKWVTACAHLPLSNKMVIGTVDSLLEVYDLSGDDIRLYCTLPPAELRHAAPICMAASAFVGRSTELLLVGDDVGTLTVYELRPDWGPAEEEVRPGRIQLLGARQVRIRQHQDHVTHVAYVPELSAIVSCSLDATVVVYDYARRCTKEVFTQHKKPVYYFAWCPTVKLIASCGLERNILLWSPYTHRAFFRLKGHSSPISRMFVTGDQLVSLGSNNVGALRARPPATCSTAAAHKRAKLTVAAGAAPAAAQ